MPFQFPSYEWAVAFRDEINRSAAYREAAKSWEGAINFVIDDMPDSLGQPTVLWIDLWHGECREAKQVDPTQPIEAPYTIHAPLANWKKVITKKLGPTQAMVSGQLRVKGNLAHILKYVKAAQELVECATRIQTEFAN
jgi:putative sterol carrier protein